MGEHLIQQKSFEFAIGIIRLYRKLQARQEFVLSPHLLRSGTSIGIKVEQALARWGHPESSDKLLAATDDAREAHYWLRLLQTSKLTDVDISVELKQVEEIISLLTEQLVEN